MIAIQISDDALDDLAGGFSFYEAQETGLGDYFATHLRADIEGLKVSAGIHRKVGRDYHRVWSRVFPYALYYTFDGAVAVVWAIVDCRRNPDWIRNRLDAGPPGAI